MPIRSFRPKILIPSRIVKDSDYQIEVQGNCSAYFESILKAGGLPISAPIGDYDDELLDELVSESSGLLLSGGEDIAPSLYGESPHPKLGEVSISRDHFEQRVFKIALKMGKPIFGICRGIQAINVFMGGTLYQDIPAEVPNAAIHDPEKDCWTASPHPIVIEKNTILNEIFGGATVLVNSIHHQAIKVLGKGLSVSARCPVDGVIEAVESKELKILAVQWHPETLWQNDPKQEMLKLFRYFVELCRD